MKTFNLYKKNNNLLFIGARLSPMVGMVLIVALGFGCKKFVEIPPPQTELVSASVFNNNASATSALMNIYVSLWQEPLSANLSQNVGLQSDELTNYSTDPDQLRIYTNSLVSSVDDGNWFSSYNQIYQANAIIQGLQQYSGVSPAVKQQLTGEAYFVRAFLHFYLTVMYGDVPLVLTTNYTTNNSLSRTPRIQVLKQVIFRSPKRPKSSK